MGKDREAAPGGLKQSWERIALRLRAELGEDLYSSWFARMEAERLDGRRLVASVPTRFLRNWIEAHYADRLHRICEGELGPLDAVSIRVRVCGMPARAVEPRKRAAPDEPRPFEPAGLGAAPMHTAAARSGVRRLITG
jgi:chromosomal replication initiator protein